MLYVVLFIMLCHIALIFLMTWTHNVNSSPLDDIQGLRECVTVPKRCPNRNITFWYYTRATQNNPRRLDITRPETIFSAKFKPNVYFKILIHGYTGWKDYSPNTEIRPALFKRAEFNVISIDYGPIVKEPCYINAVDNVKVVANCTAQLIDYLVQHAHIPLRLFHVIGFSLGAQVAGLLSEFLKSGRLSHVTGLDPAMPLFWSDNIHEKLDKSDAEFVDVIHTNALTKGKLETCGHADFYCNGGRTQPGCDAPNIESESSCNHARAPAYYAESIVSETGFWGTACTMWILDWNLDCKNATELQIMGAYVPKTARGTFFLKTNAAPPYARGYKKL